MVDFSFALTLTFKKVFRNILKLILLNYLKTLNYIHFKVVYNISKLYIILKSCNFTNYVIIVEIFYIHTVDK